MEQPPASATPIEQIAEQMLEIEAEREVPGTISTGGDALAFARAALQEWIDSVVGVVAAAGAGRVTLIHANGSRSGIASAELAYKVTPPVRFDRAGGVMCDK